MVDIVEVSVSDLADDLVILDVREPNEYAAGHAPGAVSIPLGELRERVAEVPSARPLHVICRSGARSMKAAVFLSERGIDAINIEGGTTAWEADGKPLVSEMGGVPAVVAPTTQPPASV